MKQIAKFSEATVDSMLHAVSGSCRCSALWPVVNQYCYEQAKITMGTFFRGYKADNTQSFRSNSEDTREHQKNSAHK